MSNLRVFLDQLVDEYHQPEFLYSDPLEFVHHYEDPWDQEVVAVLSAVLAYGNVKQIRRSIQNALTRMSQISKSPTDFVQRLQSTPFNKKAHSIFEDYVHRFNQGSDLVTLFSLISQSWTEHGSLGSHFLSFLEPDADDIGSALSLFIDQWRNWAGDRNTLTFSYLLTSPQDGSCCKRWCMLLRWMGRRDQLDPGLWTSQSKLAKTFKGGLSLNARQLVMPLDTHTGRISQYLGLTPRKSLNWKASVEVTQALKKINPEDPIRYDFALSRLGILDLCQRTFRADICQKCQLLPECQFAKKRKGVVHDSTPCH